MENVSDMSSRDLQNLWREYIKMMNIIDHVVEEHRKIIDTLSGVNLKSLRNGDIQGHLESIRDFSDQKDFHSEIVQNIRQELSLREETSSGHYVINSPHELLFVDSYSSDFIFMIFDHLPQILMFSSIYFWMRSYGVTFYFFVYFQRYKKNV